MKQHSMIASSVLESDDFLALPLGAQALYCHLQLHADSMGALDSLRTPMLTCGARDEDLAALFTGGWIIDAGGVPFITDWHVHNSVRDKDAHTRHPDNLAMLEYSKGSPYRLKRGSRASGPGSAQGQPRVSPGLTLLSKQANKLASNCAEPPAQVGEGGAPLDDGLCPNCRKDYLSGSTGSRRCFGCGYVEGEEEQAV